MDKEREALVRERFEQWITAPPFEKNIMRYSEKSSEWPGCYRDYAVHLAWDAWQAALTAQHTKPTSQELNQVLSDYIDNFQCDGADGEDEPVTDEQRKFARGVIDGLLADPEWDELWGRQIEEIVRQRMTAKQPADGVVVSRDFTGATCGVDFVGNGANRRNVPIVTVCFKDEDWGARDRFASALLTAAKEPR